MSDIHLLRQHVDAVGVDVWCGAQGAGHPGITEDVNQCTCKPCLRAARDLGVAAERWLLVDLDKL